jgi:hypothetical protein
MIEIWGNTQKEDMLPTHELVEWMYPVISGTEKSTLTLNLSHVRASDGIRITYDGDRDGWSIEQASVFSWDASDEKLDPDWREVAFVQAWAREKKP